ncbi:hypothetical protein [Shinella sp.]|uniref:hypothetical protein n=1 Tax=Shinella sp. TaxID=1870904 RepID=UPI003D294B90
MGLKFALSVSSDLGSKMPIVLNFDLPFSINVDGKFQITALEELFDVQLSTRYNPAPHFPGAERVEGLEILHDETSTLSNTNVAVRYIPASSNPIDVEDYPKHVTDIAVTITNSLISALRIAFDEYHIEYVYSAAKLGPIQFDVPALNGGKGFSGVYDGLQGGITFRRRPRTGQQAAPFAEALITGATLPPAEEILFNARRYLMRGDRRMALANLAISFEIGLADRLSQVAVARADAVLEAEIANATLSKLGTGLAARTLGISFANRGTWGGRFHDVFEWLRVARNGVLHKAQLKLSYEGHTRNFADKTELQALFSERDWFMCELDKAIARVLAGNPAVTAPL